MRYVVVGAGAVGGVVGGLLFRSGADVVLVARGAHLEAIRAHGLRLRTIDGESTLPVPVAGSVAEIDWRADDVVLLAVKSDATTNLLQQLAAVAPAGIPVVCLQNGVANEPAALRWFARVHGVCVLAPTSHLEPGMVQADTGPVAAVLDIGRYPAGSDATDHAVAAAFGAAGMGSEVRDDVMRWKYRKLISNLGNAVDALFTGGDAATELTRRVEQEGEQVLAAAGIEVLSRAEDVGRRGDLLRSYPGADRRGGSTFQSLSRGTGAVESDYLNGEIVLIGRTIGHPTPANTLVRDLAVRSARDGTAPRSLDAGDVLARCDG